MLTTAQDPSYFRWASQRLQAEFRYEDGCKALTVLGQDGEVRAVLVYLKFSETNCEMAIASDGSGHWLTRAALAAAFGYPFLQLGLCRVTAFVSTDNQKSLRLCRKLGFRAEGLARDWFGEAKDAVILGMTRSECRWTHGQEFNPAA